MASKHHTDDVYRPKRIPKNPIKFKLQLNEEQKQAKQIILDNTITLFRIVTGKRRQYGVYLP